MIRPARILAGIVLLAALVGQGGAGARADEPDAQARREAKRLFRAGEQAYHAGKYAMAADAFEASYALMPAPQIAFSAAQAHRLQYFVDKDPRRLERAVELFRVYLDQTPRGGYRDIAVTHLSEIEPILLRLQGTTGAAPGGLLREQPRLAEVMLTSPVEGAEGSIAGTSGALPLKVELEPGRYQATVTARGYQRGAKTIDVVAGRFFVVEVPLRPIPARLSVRTGDQATVLIDGRAAASTPLRSPVELSAGSYVLAVRKRGHRLWSRELDVDRGEAVTVAVELRRTRQRMLSYAVFGVGGLVLSGGVLSNLYAARAGREARLLADKYEADGFTREELAEYERHRTERNRATLGAYTLYGATAATALGGFLLYWLDLPDVERVQRRGPGREQRRITPILAPDVAGVSVSGRF
jgi:hypothetical protein